MKRYDFDSRRGCIYAAQEGALVKHSDALAAIEAARQEEREAIIKMLPGGNYCDPQAIADDIRARSAKP